MNNTTAENPVLSSCYSRDSDVDAFPFVLVELVLFVFTVLIGAAAGVHFRLNRRTIR